MNESTATVSFRQRLSAVRARPGLALVHRWAGLLIAGFLFFSGVTGAVISWDHELDEWLNPHLTDARASGPALSALDLARQIEARHPEVQVTFVPLAVEQGHSFGFGVAGRVNPASSRLFEPGFNQVFVDPADGAELGKREWGAVWPVTRETFVSFLYKLHYSLHLPEMWGTDQWGIWLLGVIALIWTADCFVGFYLTLPARSGVQRSTAADEALEDAPQATQHTKTWWQRWSPSWKVRWRGGSYKVNFDLHRAGGLWTWGLLFIVAFTAFSMNLYREVFFPVMSLVSDVTPSPFDLKQPTSRHAPIAAAVSFEGVLPLASAEAKSRGWEEPAGSIFYAREYGIYGVSFFRPEDDHGAGGVGHRELYLDAQDGRVLGGRQPWTGTAADIFVQAQFPLHSGRILGVPGRILISLMGLVVAMLSVTGVVVWWKKSQARSLAAARGARDKRAGVFGSGVRRDEDVVA
jgi:uncharacterized iron-regulated membrane protein